MLHENLIILVGSPRSGSTLLQRMIASHSRIYTHPEPHLLTPLAYLGYHATVDKAPYDHVNAAQALRELCEELPRGEADYLDAVRAYASTLYERVLAPTKKDFFLDKTPAYGLVLPFIAKLYPRAKYIVLTRHPLAILHSVAHSFFAGSYESAAATNPVISSYVPAIGKFILERPVDFVQVRYEDVVSEPEREMRRIITHLGLPYEPQVVEYGKQEHITKSYGDPMSVERHQRPVTDSLQSYAGDLAARPEARRIAEQLVDGLADEHLAAWGYPKAELFAALAGQKALRTRTPLNSYRIKRQVVLALRRNMQTTPLGALVRKLRYYCDVLLRT
jgi:hypothetical protein